MSFLKVWNSLQCKVVISENAETMMTRVAARMPKGVPNTRTSTRNPQLQAVLVTNPQHQAAQVDNPQHQHQHQDFSAPGRPGYQSSLPATGPLSTRLPWIPILSTSTSTRSSQLQAALVSNPQHQDHHQDYSAPGCPGYQSSAPAPAPGLLRTRLPWLPILSTRTSTRTPQHQAALVTNLAAVRKFVQTSKNISASSERSLPPM